MGYFRLSPNGSICNSICKAILGAQQSSTQESIFFSDMEIPLCVKGLQKTSPSNPLKSPSWREMQLKMDRAIVSTSLQNSQVWCDPWLGSCKIQAKAAGGGIDPAPPDITLQEEATVPKVGRASQTAGHLPILLHDLDHLTHGCRGTEGAIVCYVIMHTKMQCFTPFPIWITNRCFKTAPSNTHHLCTLRSTVKAHN